MSLRSTGVSRACVPQRMTQYPGLVTGRRTAGSPSLRPATAPTCSKNGAWAVAFAAPDAEVPVPPGVKYLAVFDPAASELTAAELLWLAAANTDPRRDVRTEGAALVIDARSKRPGAGENPGRFPNVVTASEATVALVEPPLAGIWLGGVCRFAVAALPPPGCSPTGRSGVEGGLTGTVAISCRRGCFQGILPGG